MNFPDKINLVLTYKHDPEDEDIFTEIVEAVKIGDYYKLTHVPAFAPNIAYGDIVAVEYDDGTFHFEEMIEESGFSVARIIIWKQEFKDGVISSLEEIGCGINTHIADNYVVVSIPPEVAYRKVRDILTLEKHVKNIDFGDCLSGKTCKRYWHNSINGANILPENVDNLWL